MPQHEEHCLHSEKRYGVRGDDIHTWIDEPSQISGGSHRNYRHDLNSLPTAIQMFGKVYGAEMVENIFLDHLKADSEENRKRKIEQEGEEGAVSPNIWTKDEDDYLSKFFSKKTDQELELDLKLKSKSAIQKRRNYLGLIRPKIIKRTRNYQREQRLVFRLEKGQRFFMTMKIEGGNNDIKFYVTDLKKNWILPQRVYLEKNIEFVPQVTGNYSFVFSNSFSHITSKKVHVSYHLENGREIRMLIEL
jgi:hypothetical protein